MSRLFLASLMLLASLATYAQTKCVLVEEVTGTWCQWCTSGLYFGEYLTEYYDNVLVVSIHENDVMEYTEYFEASGLTAFPTANVDRLYSDIDPFGWENLTTALSGVVPPADVLVDVEFDSGTQMLSVVVSSLIYNTMNGDYRLGAIVVEDGITGPSPDYDQSNSWSGSDEDLGGYEDLPSPVPANLMVYNHVARHLLGNYDGEAGSLPATLLEGTEYSHEFQWQVPEEYDPNYMKVYGVLIKQSNGEIINCGKSLYLNGQSNATPFFTSDVTIYGSVNSPVNSLLLATDPDDQVLIIDDLADLPAWLTYTDNDGGEVQLSGTPLAEGSFPFTLTVSDGNTSTQKEFSLEIGPEQTDDWIIVGDEDASGAPVFRNELEISQQGIPFLLTGGQNDILSVRKFNGTEWETVGGSIDGSAFHLALEIDPDHQPWIATINDGLKVWKLENDQWVLVGGTAITGSVAHIDMEISADGLIYVVGMEQSGASFVAQYDEGSDSWIQLGAALGNTAVWNKIISNQWGQLYALWNDFANGMSHVSQWGSASWQDLGSVSSQSVYFDHAISVGDDGSIYVAILDADQLVDVFVYSDELWNVHWSDAFFGAVEGLDMRITDSQELIIAAEDLTQSAAISVVSIDSNSISYVGLPGLSPIGAGSIVLALSPDDVPYVSYRNSVIDERSTVEVYGEVTIDINEKPRPDQMLVFPNPSYGELNFSQAIEGIISLYNARECWWKSGKFQLLEAL